MGHQEDALKLFLTENIIEAKDLTKKLNKYNLERQEKEKDIYKQALEQLQNENIKDKSTIVLCGDNWFHGVIGIVASKITESFFKPTILIGFEDDIGKGSGRSIPGFDLHDALSLSEEFLEKYGGHAMAVGLTLKKDNFNKFKNKFEEIAQNKEIKQIQQLIKVDSIITKEDINFTTLKEIKKLEPFGEKNPRPNFLYKNLKINSIRALSDGKHLKLTLKDNNIFIDAIGFNLGYLAEEFLIGDKIDIVGSLEENSFNGIEKIQINIKDIMKSV